MAKKILLLILTLILSLGLFACSKEPEMVQVTFVGLDGEVIKTEEVVLGHTVAFPADPAVDGYEFTGWFLAENEPIPEVLRGYYKPAKSLSVYAHFRELNTNTVTFYDQNGNVVQTIKVREDQAIDFVNSQPKPNAPDDKIFTGWYIKGTNTPVDENYFVQNPVLADMQLVAGFRDKIVYTVTLMNGEDVYDTIKVAEDKNYTFSVDDPEKENFTFDGWYLNADGTDAPYDGTRPSADITLYAHFSEIPLFGVFKNEVDGTCTIGALNAYYLDKTKNLVIPETVSIDGTTYTVVGIGNEAFKDNGVLTSVTLPSTLKEIGISAFAGCTSLSEMILPEALTTIGESAFHDCTALTTLTVPTAVTKIGESAFKGTAIATLTAPVWVVAFVDTAKLETVMLTAGESIPEKLFKNAKSLKVLTLAAEFKTIEAEAFAGSLCLKEIEIPASVTSIAPNAFAACSALEAITVAEGNTVYMSNDSNCIVDVATKTLLIACQNTTVYDGIEAIAEGAFLDCKNLKALHIPASVKTISEGFLSGCTALESLTVDAANTDYISVDNCLIRLSDTCVIQGCKTSVLPKEFKVGDEDKAISSISAKAFAGCTGLKEINIPESISTLKANTFKGCTALAKITVNNPEMVIEENAFAGCSAITDITVPYSLVKTFLALSKKTLTKVTLLDGEAIEENLFEGCSTLEAVTLPTTVQTIGAYAFSGCGLKALNLAENASLTSIGYKAFANCKALVEINLPSDVSEADYDAFSGCTALTKASLGADIMRCLLVAASNITELNITSGEALDYETVRALTALESLSLSKNIATVDARSLRACTKLVNITIAAENTTIKVENDYVLEIATGKLVFAAAKTVITLSESVKTIGAYAFVGTGIEEILIPATVEKIENFAFTACRSLKKLEILGEPTIEEFAFEGCDAIETVKAYESAFAYLNQVTIKTKDVIPATDAGNESNSEPPNE